MKRVFTLSGILFFIVFNSCAPDNADEVLAEEMVEEQEYFNAIIDGKPFVVNDPEMMGGFVFTNPETGIISLDLYGEIEGKEEYEGLYFLLCFYDGAKTYYTGNTHNVSYADYIKGWDIYSNDWTLHDPGTVVIKNASETFVEGEFIFRAYNVDGPGEIIEVTGSFGVKIDTSEGY